MYSTLPLSPNKLKLASLYLVLMISSLVVASLYPRQLKFLMLPLLKQLTPWPLWTTFTQAPLPKTKLRIKLNNNPNSRLSSPLWTSISANLQHSSTLSLGNRSLHSVWNGTVTTALSLTIIRNSASVLIAANAVAAATYCRRPFHCFWWSDWTQHSPSITCPAIHDYLTLTLRPTELEQ